ncbi:MAG: hypothetical protein OQK48_06985 [Sulfurimonas sp.]|uniref:hypothetical protein n=1 Tax=Sulfurimonas sp. TaxID=2022749 RepID=UPI002636BEB4|nr:hypothetical protein [Sulfurimonas sp.]MCW8895220.1 hypothetical protein [Sulfurimonas sp.]MCW8954675.1 hypothetical protein [Sulfurimonas sp.]MCW9068267.1 hypothetical protein [Sulfurimonas sp.]
MRSRDGNRNFSLRLCSVILFSSLALNAGEYLISYRYVVKNATLFNEKLHISKAMKPCSGEPQRELILENSTDGNLKKLISQNSDEFLEYIHKLDLHVQHEEQTTNLQNKFTTILTMKTTCFKVDFNDNFAIIAPLK